MCYIIPLREWKGPLPDKVILWHRGPLGWDLTSFDLLVRKGVELEKGELEFVDSLYRVKCPIAAAFVRMYPEYEHLGSEDLLHASDIAEALKRRLENLANRHGWQAVAFDSDDNVEGER